MLWQLRRLSTNENLNQPQPLPENWHGIFGLSNIKDKLGDLSWLNNPDVDDMGWFETNLPDPDPRVPLTKADIDDTAKKLLQSSDWTMLSDVPITKETRLRWEAYRKALREIDLQADYPNSVTWPTEP